MNSFELFKEKFRFKIYLPSRRLYSLFTDRFYGIDTEEIASLSSLGLSDDAGERCESTPTGEFLKMMKLLPVNSEDVFLDIGCGKGRTLLLAGRFPFKKIIGVDLSEKLRTIAETNINTMRSRLVCQNYELVTSNALDYRIQDDVTYVYFFNPFSYQILHKVLAGLLMSVKEHPRKVTLIYYNPRYSADMEKDFPVKKVQTLEFHHWSLYKSRFNVYQFNS